MKKIIHNRCKCSLCGDIIESKHRHDFVACKCEAIFTDGGKDYIRRGYYKKAAKIIDMSVFAPYSYEEWQRMINFEKEYTEEYKKEKYEQYLKEFN